MARNAARKGLSSLPTAMAHRRRITVEGAVQGVGFRPFVYRLAQAMGLSGWVLNDAAGVVIEVEVTRDKESGEADGLVDFESQLRQQAPPAALLTKVTSVEIAARGDRGFVIRHSRGHGKKTVLVQADLATCSECLGDIREGRRRGYPFTNCTNCGPRFSILRGLPYDRPQTTMASFEMCVACQREYDDPNDRRFHAQPNACPVCGPTLRLLRQSGEKIETEDPIAAAAAQLRAGRILACKGLGGFHLMVDATRAEVVDRLRAKKHRPHKPFALMVRDLQMAAEVAELHPAAAAAMSASSCPIILLPRLPEANLAAGVAPGLDVVGVMLPSTPLHHLLFEAVDVPLVATSGNVSDEPICVSTAEALERLGEIADFFLTHDRSVVRPLDDSVAWIPLDKAETKGGVDLQLIRRARGFAPLPFAYRVALPTVLAVGGQQKNTVALSVGNQVLMSQHLGDLDHPKARAAFESAAVELCDLYGVEPDLIVHDLHPDYASTQWAQAVTSTGGRFAGVKRMGVQHHHAHLVACLAEHDTQGPALGLCWDGTGFGTDGTIWGGEALLGDVNGFSRFATVHPFRLAGGVAAIREPRRVALALADAVGMADAFANENLEDAFLLDMIRRGVSSPLTTSMGRLFDGVAALLGLISGAQTFEAQAAMAMECAARNRPADVVGDARSLLSPASMALLPQGPYPPQRVIDWRPLISRLLSDASPQEAAARFHLSLAKTAVDIACAAGVEQVALTGGCFQNRLLLQMTVDGLTAAGVRPLLHRIVPVNDGGLAVGQILIGAAFLKNRNVV